MSARSRLLTRAPITALFLVFTAGAAARTAGAVGDAGADPMLRTWLLVADAALKTLVAGAFTVFVLLREPPRRRSREPLAWLACAAAVLPVMLLRPPSSHATIADVVAGEALVILAVCFVLASVLSLGTCFGVLPEARGLVTRGPYRLVRHPVYLGEISAFAGFTLASQRFANVVLLVILTAAQLLRSRFEEAALSAEFPEQYAAFRTTTPRLLPRLRPRAKSTVAADATWTPSQPDPAPAGL